MNYADLHIHSLYSDGSYSPEEIVRRAKANSVKLLAVTDHNVVTGSLATAPLARAAGLDYICGVEIDALHKGVDVHILCYDADFTDEALLGRIRHARARLDEMSIELLRRMTADYPQLSIADYDAFSHDSNRGGWKMLQYMQARGVTPDLKSGFAYYDRYCVTYADAGFDSAEEIVRRIHAAGGKAVLAHPGVVFPTEYLSIFEQHVQDVLDTGIDGIECHYLRHTPPITRRCIEICNQRSLFITAGSDCHGAFNKNAIGQTQTKVEQLRLW